MFATYTLVLAFSVCASSAVLSPRTNSTTPISGSIVPGAYIVKFAAGHESADSFYHNLTEAGCDAVHRQTFNADVFSGTSFHLPDGNLDIDQILSFDQVESISPVRVFSLASTQARDPQDVIEKVQKSKIKRVSRSLSDANDTVTPHIMAGVDKLHAEGLDGEGIKIAIIDTGIDYTLPALGAGFGPGYKVVFGTDLVGDAYDGLNTPVPDDDPIDCYGHGTHVAGILGASNDPYVLGVAPNATLGIYKVFGCIDATVANDVLISAFTMAYNEGVDMITSSIEFANGWPEEPWAAAVAAIVAAGTPCMLSAGNDGTDGIFYTSSASAGNDITSVGSVENTYLPEVLTEAAYSIDGDSQIPFGYNIATGTFGNVSLPIWADTYDMTIVDDGCSGFSANLTGLIALIRRGTCTFDTKVGNALNAGATYVIFYNNVPGTISGLVNNLLVDGAAMVNPEVGATWINALAAGEKVILTFNTNGTLLVSSPGTVNNVTGGYLDTFTSWGLTNENTIKPVVSAPGGSILSTYLSSAGGYTVMSGTSMATPFIAGVVALYIQFKGYEKVTPQEINAALSLSATPLSYDDGTTTYSYLASVAQQGAGLINAYSMIHSALTISQANLALNDTANFVKESRINLTNTGTVAMTYILSHEPASNVYTFNSGNKYNVVAFPPPLDTQYSTAIITPSTLTLDPGEDGTVSVSITPNPDLDNSTLPVYSGYIKITGGDETYSIPYAGVAATMADIPIVVPGSTFFNSLYAPSTVNFNGTTIRGYTAETPLTFYFTNSWATSLARVDIVGVNETNPVVVSGLDMVGSVIGFPQTYLRRNSGGAALFNGTLADGSVVESGVYKFVLRVAKVFGDLDKGEYEEYISDYFFISTD